MARLEAKGLAKRYGATVALDHVHLALEAGRVHALIGENGAGKSTLVKLLMGRTRATHGEMTLDGARYQPGSVLDALEASIAAAFQELSLIPSLSVAENLFLPDPPNGPFRWAPQRQLIRRATALLADYELNDLDASLTVDQLSLAKKQQIEIVKAAAREPNVIILDEPTGALTDTKWLFSLIRAITDQGKCVLYITHKLAELRAICDEVTVLRNGSVSAHSPIDAIDDSSILSHMLGYESGDRFPPTDHDGEHGAVALEGCAISGEGLAATDVRVCQGEIVGVAGLEGQGQRELFALLCGERALEQGHIEAYGKAVRFASPADARRAGITLVPEDRKSEGIFPGMSTRENLTLPILPGLQRYWMVNRRLERDKAFASADSVSIKRDVVDSDILRLSGGNQQKAIIGRALIDSPRVLLLFDPTRGVDIGTKREIYDLMRAFTRNGGAVVFYSTELSELVNLCHRCLVFYGWRCTAKMEGESLTEENLLSQVMGVSASSDPHAPMSGASQ